MSETTRKTINDLFPRRFVRGRDLRGPILARLTSVGVEVVHPRPGVEEQAYVVRFEHLDPKTRQSVPLRGFRRDRHGYAVILRRTLAEQIAEVAGAESVEDWNGRVVVLELATMAGKVTIKARAARQAAAPTPATPEQA